MTTIAARSRSTTVAVLVLLMAAAACVPGRGPDAEATVVADPDAEATAGSELVVDVIENPVRCDGSSRPVIGFRGAQPFEGIIVTSSGGVVVPPGAADDEGDYTLRWICTEADAGARWELTATGQTSGRAATVVLEALDEGTVPLSISALRDELVCDGRSKDLAVLSGAAPGERIRFESAEATGIEPGVADAAGELALRWTCDDRGVGRTWTVTAISERSARRLEFSFTGVAPEGGVTAGPAFEFVESPFVCDGGARPLATLSGFDPGEVIGFESPQSPGLRDGQADDEGRLTARWQCGADDVGTTWELTAIGRTSGRTATLTFAGAAPIVTGPDPVITIDENPFACDGTSRVFGTISNLVANEFVDFTSPQTGNLRQGQADADGRLPVRWSCDAADVGTTWQVTATGQSSRRPVTFSLTGALPAE